MPEEEAPHIGVVNKLSTDLGKILKMPDTRERLVAQAHESFYRPSAQFTTQIRKG